jgi:DNA-binding NarL/FixJ family response regulator
MSNKTKINIFIVDDNKIFSLALKKHIEDSFKEKVAKIYSFETGEKCMERFPQIMPELVILDYHLNSRIHEAEDGNKVLNWIKQQNESTSVIILTNDDNIDIALKCFHQGASDYVVKAESQFRKIDYSISNVLKIRDAKNESKKYKQLLVVLFLGIALFIGGVIGIQVFSPSLVRQ